MKRFLLLTFLAVCISNVYSQDALIKANNDFSFKIYNATKSDLKNFFISPFSLNIALSIANEGANTTTRQEMDKLLSIEKMDNRADSYHTLINNVTSPMNFEKNPVNQIYLANSMWINESLKLNDTFQKIVENNYSSEIYRFSTKNLSTANRELNDWVSQKTHNTIKKISGIDKGTRLSIVNAIYFMGEWNIPFKTEKTKEKKFHTIQKEEIDVDFMNIKAYYNYYEDDEIQCVKLPYKWNQFEMIVVLPKEMYGLNEVEKKLNPAYLSKIEQSNPSCEVQLSFPKFKIESVIFPIASIEEMGYSEMFSGKADFSNISDEFLKIGNITHKTFIEIDETKTVAAAVTELGMVGRATMRKTPPTTKIFNADHPFIFLIVEKKTNAILFIGRFVE